MFYLADLLRTVAWDVASQMALKDCSKEGARRHSSFCWKKTHVVEHQSLTANHKTDRHFKLMILVLFYLLGKYARVWAHWSYSFDTHLNYLGPVSCFSPSRIPLRVHRQGSRSDRWLYILCFLKWQVTFFVHIGYAEEVSKNLDSCMAEIVRGSVPSMCSTVLRSTMCS